MQDYLAQALKDINENVHVKGEIEILDEGLYYYKFMFIGTQTDHSNNTIIKLLELSDTDFNEDNKIYRFSLEELREGRAYYLEKEAKKKEKFNKLFPNLKQLWA